MTQQDGGRRKTVQAVRRQGAIVVGVLAALGLVAGGVFAVLSPPVLASNAIVAFPAATDDIATLVVIATSNEVLLGAQPHIRPATSLQALYSSVQAKSLTSTIISVGAQGKTAAQAESTANAVADSFAAYVSSAHSAGGQVRPRLLEPAMDATGTPLSHRLLVPAGLGAVLGALLGAIAVIRRSRSDRRFRMT
jgi:capsular polysaccharide biosynthesis protein